MRVERLQLTDFRNYTTLEFAPGPGLNVVVGPNAQGKTNLLEAVYALVTTKSHRTSKDSELIRFGTSVARVVAEIEKTSALSVQLELALGLAGAGTERKLVKVNHSKQPRLTDLLGNLNAVLFASTDLDIIRGEPEERRRFLNYEISQLSPRYALALAAYRRALENRNRLLKDMKQGHGDTGTLEAWSGPLIDNGARLIERRKQFLTRLSALAAEVHSVLTSGKETLRVVYEASFDTEGATTHTELVERFTTELRACRREELARGITVRGPQRDDLRFEIGAPETTLRDARSFGSQGQQRTVALSLRLAERRLIEEEIGEPPVVLLDDVLSDLDEYRRGQIFALALSGGQTFLTTTDLAPIPLDALRSARVVTIRDGVLRDA